MITHSYLLVQTVFSQQHVASMHCPMRQSPAGRGAHLCRSSFVVRHCCLSVRVLHAVQKLPFTRPNACAHYSSRVSPQSPTGRRVLDNVYDGTNDAIPGTPTDSENPVHSSNNGDLNDLNDRQASTSYSDRPSQANNHSSTAHDQQTELSSWQDQDYNHSQQTAAATWRDGDSGSARPGWSNQTDWGEVESLGEWGAPASVHASSWMPYSSSNGNVNDGSSQQQYATSSNATYSEQNTAAASDGANFDPLCSSPGSSYQGEGWDQAAYDAGSFAGAQPGSYSSQPLLPSDITLITPRDAVSIGITAASVQQCHVWQWQFT